MVPKAVFTLRMACTEDAPVIYAIHKTSLTTLCVTHYSLDALQRWFSSRTVEGYYPAIDRGEMFVCESGENVVGFGHAVPGEVVAIFVHPDFAGQGVGTCLLNNAISCARRGHPGPIKVIAMLNAQRFYENHGFFEVQQYVISRGSLELPVIEMELTLNQTDLNGVPHS
jgi:GNAT superfamily N-acetyltransferase